MLDTAAPTLTVDIGGTTTRVAVVEGRVLRQRHEMPTRAATGPEDLIRRLLALIAEVWPGQAPGTVGVACTGRVHGGHVTAVNTQTMPGWRSVPLQAALEGALGVPVAVLNDAKAATLGEWQAQPVTSGNFMFVTVSTGIGSGLVLGGRLHDPADGSDVGLGFTCGQGGDALEHGSSGTGLHRVALAGGYSTVAALFDAAERKDAEAQGLLHAPLLTLAQRLWDAHCLLGLSTVCVGGSVGLRPYTREFLTGFFSQFAAPAIREARYGADAGLIGAALFAEQQKPHA